MHRITKLVLGTVATALAVAPVAGAQESVDEQLAGYVGMASGAAFSVQPIFPGLLPTGDAPFEVTAALSAANIKSGGNAFGQASVLWPGSAIAGIGPLMGAAADPVFAEVIPPYPGQVSASQDDGEVAHGAAPGPVMRAVGEPARAEAESSAANGELPEVLTVKKVSSLSRSLVEGGNLITESTVTLHGVSLGGGAVTIDTLKSVARATSDGNKATSTGSTVVSGLEIGGQAAELTEEGLSSKGLPVKALAAALEGAGITLELTKAAGAADGGTADRVSSGLVVTMANPLASANPQFEGSKFVISLAPTAVGALASPPFEFDFDQDFPIAPVEGGGSGGGGFSEIAATVSETFDGGSGAVTGGESGGGGTSGPLAFEPARRALEAVGGVSTGMLIGLLAAGWYAARWINRYVARFVTTEE